MLRLNYNRMIFVQLTELTVPMNSAQEVIKNEIKWKCCTREVRRKTRSDYLGHPREDRALLISVDSEPQNRGSSAAIIGYHGSRDSVDGVPQLSTVPKERALPLVSQNGQRVGSNGIDMERSERSPMKSSLGTHLSHRCITAINNQQGVHGCCGD